MKLSLSLHLHFVLYPQQGFLKFQKTSFLLPCSGDDEAVVVSFHLFPSWFPNAYLKQYWKYTLKTYMLYNLQHINKVLISTSPTSSESIYVKALAESPAFQTWEGRPALQKICTVLQQCNSPPLYNPSLPHPPFPCSCNAECSRSLAASTPVLHLAFYASIYL